MTHDELLAKVYPAWDEYVDNSKFRNALRAVVELHKPEPIATPCPDGRSGCAVMHWSDKKACSCGFWNYPCPTIQAIEKELK
jgi:hypothetical protein